MIQVSHALNITVYCTPAEVVGSQVWTEVRVDSSLTLSLVLGANAGTGANAGAAAAVVGVQASWLNIAGRGLPRASVSHGCGIAAVCQTAGCGLARCSALSSNLPVAEAGDICCP